MSAPPEKLPFDKVKFLSQFQGMEDIAMGAVDSFLAALPKLVEELDASILEKNLPKIEITAHSIKGAVSVFYAEPSRTLAWQMERQAHEKKLENIEALLQELKGELEKLKLALSAFSCGRAAA